MPLTFSIATHTDVPTIAILRNAASQRLTQEFGVGHWTHMTTERSVELGISNTSHVILGKLDDKIVGTFRLAQKKPWAIDASYFTPVKRPLYLVDMAVAPQVQGKGIGRELLEEAKHQAIAWPAEAIRLDAYDAVGGAGSFYAKCGYTEVGRVVYRGTPLIYYEMIL